MPHSANLLLAPMLVAIMLFAQSGCASKPDDQTVSQRQQDEVLQAALAAQDQGIVCEHIVRVGSRIARKVCTTAVQRQLQEEKGRKYVEHVQRRAR